jgi:uncharacterized membrane protein YphA (DoxX/SURF4 family)
MVVKPFRPAGNMAQSLTTETPAAEKRSRMTCRGIAVHVLAALLGLAFLASGGMKLAGMDEEGFARFGYPGWFFRVIGLAELAGGLLVLLPATRRYGGAVICCVMTGALVTHLKMGETGDLAPPAVLFLMAAVLVWVYRPRLQPGATSEP